MESTPGRSLAIIESDKAYRILFYFGGACNILVAALLLPMIHELPRMIGIEAPHHTIFIYFNVMTLVIFGCMQWTVARNLRNNRSMVTLLMWAKLSMAIAFLYALIIDPPVKELSLFLAPSVSFDFLLGLLFWRFLVYSRSPA